MSIVSIKQLLEAGVHFGHHTRRWNPKMAEYIFTERNGIYIIDLQKTVRKLEEAYMFIRDIVSCIPEPKPNYNTVATQVKFLEEKGYVVRKPMANSFQYSPAVPESEYRSTAVKDIVSKHYNNSFISMVSQFVEEDEMGLEELKALISTIESKRK